MYLDAYSLLQDEHDALQPYEALLSLSDDELDVEVADAGGWSARDLLGHIVLWQEAALATARELAVGPRSATMERLEAQWASAPEAGDAMNAEGIARFRAMSAEEVRAAFKTTAGELRGYLTVVPEARWIKDAKNQEYFLGETADHYTDHVKELRAILAALGR